MFILLFFQHADPSWNDIWLGVALLLTILVTGIFSFVKESQQASIQRDIERLVPRTAKVIRECIEMEVPAEELVLGKEICRKPLRCRVIVSVGAVGAAAPIDFQEHLFCNHRF